MRVLLVTTYFEPDSGAAAVRLTRLAKQLQGRGHQVTVLTTMPHYPHGRIAEGYRGRFTTTETRDGICIVRAWLYATPSPRISRRLVSQLSFMVAAALRGLALPRPDVVLIEAQPVFTGLAGAFVSRLKRAPYVLNVSDLWPDHLLSVGALTETHPVYRAARWLVDGLYRGAAGIVAMSPAWADVIAGYTGSDEKIRVIYNGVDLERFRPDVDTSAFRARYNLGDQKIVSFIGTFATQYDFDLMLDVAVRFQNRPDVLFLLIGDGTQAQVVRARLAGNSLPNARWLGWLGNNDLPCAWAASHLTFWAMRDHPLYRGTIPAKLYELAASGVPLAAAMEGIGADLIASMGAGLTVLCGDADGLEASIARLLDDESFHAACRRSARAYAEKHFESERVAAAYEGVLAKYARKSEMGSVR